MNTLSHIAIIMDGNGRWAKKRGKPRNFGHKVGLSNIKNIIQSCVLNNVKYLSLYVFSLDNWNRSGLEIKYLFNLLESYLSKDVNYLIKKKIKIKILGEKYRLDKKLIQKFKKIETLTSKNFNITVNLLFNYSSKKEIVNSANRCIQKYKKKNLSSNNISENLYTKFIPDPEILIRTGGTNRLSDFLLWQLAYTEIFFIKKLWPDFDSNDLDVIIKKYYKIQRNFGSAND